MVLHGLRGLWDYLNQDSQDYRISKIVDGLTFLGPVNAYSGNPMKTTHYCRSLYDPENLSILVQTIDIPHTQGYLVLRIFRFSI